MLLIEKTVKLLDDFHFGIFREYVKNLSLRSYYPLALLDVIDRSFEKEQDSEKLFKAVYGEAPDGEKDMKKFFQLAHHTFKLTGFLARNYPDYLQHNITRIQHLVNIGELDKATRLAEMLLDISSKIEDFTSEIKVLQFLAQRESLLESFKQAMDYHERIRIVLRHKEALNEIMFVVSEQLKEKITEDKAKLNELLLVFKKYYNSESIVVQLMARLNACFFMHMFRDSRFYEENNFKELEAMEEALEKNSYVVYPHLFNLRPKLGFLKLNFSIRQLNTDKILNETDEIIRQNEEDLFWNSFVNRAEINSIAIQSSHLVTNFFTSYRFDHLEKLPDETKQRIDFLKNKCEHLMESRHLQAQFIRYINVSTIYAGLLLLGSKNEIEKSYILLENLLLSYQQVPFHAYIDPIFLNMIMAAFCLQDFDKVEKSYRRYKKSTNGKAVNPENDLTLHGFYYAAKWLETKREQYIKKFDTILQKTMENAHLNTTRHLLEEVSQYFQFPQLSN